MAVAAQLHDRLAQHGFSPFIDRFHLAPGQDVQQEIANQLEDCALLLLVETPLAQEPDWVFDEVDYILSRNLGLHIITWPDVSKPVPGTAGLARQRIDDLYKLDKTRAKFPDAPPGVLIYAPRHIPAARREVLTWAGASRDLALVPENAIGGYWRSADVR